MARSRGVSSAEKAVPVAAEVTERLAGVEGAGTVTGAANADACEQADVVLLAVPYDGHDELVASLPLAGKTVISCVNPLAFDKRGAHGRVVDGGEGSAAEEAQRLQPEARRAVLPRHPGHESPPPRRLTARCGPVPQERTIQQDCKVAPEGSFWDFVPHRSYSSRPAFVARNR